MNSQKIQQLMVTVHKKKPTSYEDYYKNKKSMVWAKKFNSLLSKLKRVVKKVLKK